MNWGMLQSLHVYTEIGWPPVSKCARNEVYGGEPYPRVISIASTSGRNSPAPVSPLMSLECNVRVNLASVSSLDESFLSERKTTWVPRRLSGKAELSEGILRSRAKRCCCNKSKSPECRDHDSDLKTTVGIQVPDR